MMSLVDTKSYGVSSLSLAFPSTHFLGSSHGNLFSALVARSNSPPKVVNGVIFLPSMV